MDFAHLIFVLSYVYDTIFSCHRIVENLINIILYIVFALNTQRTRADFWISILFDLIILI